MQTNYPDIANEWNYEKNNGVTPSDVISKTGKVFWWICPKGHEYEARVSSRVSGRGCPYCSNWNKIPVIGVNDLATTNPDILEFWDYKKNLDIKPTDISYGSRKKVWWVCKNGHSFKSVVQSFVSKRGCPICNKSMKSSFPEQAIYYYVKKEFPDAINGYKEIFNRTMELDIFIPSLKVGIEYDGKAYHNKKTMEKDYRKFEICKQNKIILIRIREMSQASGISVDWHHKIDIPIANSDWLNWAIHELLFHLDKDVYPDVEKDRNNIMSQLDKRKINLLNSFPEIAKEWDYIKNDPLLPENVSPNSKILVWWSCPDCHLSYQRTITSRTHLKSISCPRCKERKNSGL